MSPGNDLSIEFAQTLSQLLKLKLTSLEELHLDDNEFGNEGVDLIVPSLSALSRLNTLSLCFCELTASTAYKVARSVEYDVVLYDVVYSYDRCRCRAVAKLPSMVVLRIYGNDLSKRGVKEIRSVMARANKIVEGGPCYEHMTYKSGHAQTHLSSNVRQFIQSRMFFIFSDVDGVDENGDDDDLDDDDLDDVLEDDEVGDNQDNSDELAAALANVNI